MGYNLKIIVCCHKEDPNIREDSIYMPLHVGKTLSNKDLGFQGDDSGDNISYKNKNYCELTGLYWAWKNLKCEYIGLCHYRRYFNLDASQINCEKFFDKYDIVLPKVNILPFNLAESFSSLLTREDLYLLLTVLFDKYPQHKKKIIDYFYNNNHSTSFNMFISKKELSDKYCEWLFDILLELEKLLKESGYSRLRRIYGYIGEYLLPLFCKINDLNVKRINVVQFTENQSGKFHNILHYMDNIRKNLVFFLLKYPLKNFPPSMNAIRIGLINDGINIIDDYKYRK